MVVSAAKALAWRKRPMKRHTSVTLVMAAVCCCTLIHPAIAEGVRDSVQSTDRERIPDRHPDSDAVQSLERRVEQGDLEAMNSLAIRYARGRGVTKDYRAAARLFRQSAVQGYAPAMANLGTIYEMGAIGRRDYNAAYAWVRAALSFGVPEEDHDATVYKLGLIASRFSPGQVVRAEELARDIADKISQQCGHPADHYTGWRFN
jgi:hypothetical protein